MTATVLTVLGGVLIALIAAMAPSFGAKQERDLALQEIELAAKVGNSATADRLQEIVSMRAVLWHSSVDRRFSWSRLGHKFLVVGILLMAIFIAFGYWLEPSTTAGTVRSYVDAARGLAGLLGLLVLIASAVLTLAGLVEAIAQDRRRSKKLKALTEAASGPQRSEDTRSGARAEPGP